MFVAAITIIDRDSLRSYSVTTILVNARIARSSLSTMSRKQKYYAVSVGRDGPMIYSTWDECKAKVSRFAGSVFKSFSSRQEAERWLRVRTAHNDAAPQPQGESSPRELPDPVSCPPESPPTIALSRDQQRILDYVKQGRSVFFTGSAGTGKSVLLRAIIDHFGGGPSAQLAITASTGIAAVNIGGCTLHSWAGIGLGKESETKLYYKLYNFEPVRDRWQLVKTLIIDEISMIDGTLFDKLESLARSLRRNSSAFGGIQLVLSGDFCQLPPVPDRGPRGEEIPATFAFEANSWNRCVGQPMNLTQVFRQKDQAFVDMLNAIRFGKTSVSTARAFRQLARTVTYEDGIEPTELFPTRAEVDHANRTRLEQLPDKAHIYEARDTPGVDSNGKRVSIAQMERLLDRMVAQKALELKVGAQVMLIKNLKQGVLVNGSLGRVVAFTSLERADDLPERSDRIPSGPTWPTVQFTNGMKIVVSPVDFTVHNANGEMEAGRAQVPLILSYALSVHKSQGQTLERLKVDLRRTFEKGQAYVALSRATTMERLQILNFDPDKIVAHPRVLEWTGITDDTNEFYDSFYDEMDSYDAIATYYDS